MGRNCNEVTQEVTLHQGVKLRFSMYNCAVIQVLKQFVEMKLSYPRHVQITLIHFIPFHNTDKFETYLLPLDATGTGRHEAVHHSRHRRLLVPAPSCRCLLRLLQLCLGHAAVGAHEQRGTAAASRCHSGGAQLAVAATKSFQMKVELIFWFVQDISDLINFPG